jgi:hypothetical protein
MIAGPFPDIIYRSPQRARRRPFKWQRVGGGFFRKLPSERERRFVPDRARLLELGAGPDSTAERWAADHVAWRDGDETVRARLTAEHEASLAYGKMLADRLRGDGIGDKRYEAVGANGKETLAQPSELRRIAGRLRVLMAANDPDAIRAGLAEIADALDEMAEPAAATTTATAA